MTIGVSQKPTSEFERNIMALLSHSGRPIPYDDACMSLVADAAKAVWDAMTPIDRDRLALESARRVAELLGSEGSPA